MIFDTHCHYNLPPLAESWQAHWQKAQAKGVSKSVVVGTSMTTSQLATQIAESDQNLWAAVAIHPIEFLSSSNNNFVSALATLLPNKKIIAIGETGLDYYHLQRDTQFSEERKHEVIAAQKKSLSDHIALAQRFKLPLILHVRDVGEHAYWDTLELLEKEHYAGKFVLHCVSGPTAYVQKALSMGGYISAAGNITYKNADHIRDMVRFAPKERILVETDAPYLPPQEFRGQECEPWMIAKTSDFLDQELGIPSEVTWQNAHTFFGLE